MNKEFFSPDEFKKWVKKQEVVDDKPIQNEAAVEKPEENLVGKEVLSKITGYKKLLSKMEIDRGNERDVCREFVYRGGTVLEYNEGICLVEVGKGSFFIHEKYLET